MYYEKKPEIVQAIQIPVACQLNVAGKLIDFGSGDWIVTGANGSVNKEDDGTFKEKYRTYTKAAAAPVPEKKRPGRKPGMQYKTKPKEVALPQVDPRVEEAEPAEKPNAEVSNLPPWPGITQAA
jgi:hypothetical protein